MTLVAVRMTVLAVVLIACTSTQAHAASCPSGKVRVTVQAKRTCVSAAKAFPKPQAGNARVAAVNRALGFAPRGLRDKRGRRLRPFDARAAKKIRRGFAWVLPRVDALTAGHARIAASGCGGAPFTGDDFKSAIGGVKLTASFDGLEAAVRAEYERDGLRFRVVYSSCVDDAVTVPACPTADGVVDGRSRRYDRVETVITKGGDTIKKQTTVMRRETTYHGQVADDAKLDSLDVTDASTVDFTTGRVGIHATVDRTARVDMRNGAYTADGGAVKAAADVDGVRAEEQAALAAAREVLSGDDRDFATTVDAAITAYRQREGGQPGIPNQGWQEPNKCVALDFAAASGTLLLKKGDSGAFSASARSRAGGTAAKARWTLSDPSAATFAPTTSKAAKPSFQYGVLADGDGVTVSTGVRATSTAGVGALQWFQPTASATPTPTPTPAPKPYSGTFIGTAEYMGMQGVTGSASWSGSLTLTPSRYYPAMYGQDAIRSYTISTGSVQYAFHGTNTGSGCTIDAAGPVDIAGEAQGDMQITEGATRAYRFVLSFPPSATVPGTNSACPDPEANGPTTWYVNIGVPGLLGDPNTTRPVPSDDHIAGSAPGNVSGYIPQTWTWDLRP